MSKMPRFNFNFVQRLIEGIATMRVLNLVALLALPLLSLAAKKPSTSTFDTYFAKQSSSSPIEVDEKGYNELTTASRDYSVAVLLTALPAKYACQICRDFDSEWSIIGRSWQKGDRKGDKRVILATVDFDKGKEVFMKVSDPNTPPGHLVKID
jgi:oligosaccharyltransferase complex subunit gamma